MVNDAIIGWDIGGAHLKMAIVDAGGQVISASQFPTPLWQGMDTLHNTLSRASKLYPQYATARHVVTTTAELVDIFRDRKQGMQSLANCLLGALDNNSIQFYGGDSEWISHRVVERYYQKIASANWHATASYTASIVTDGLLLDIGSTTTDIIGFRNGKICNQGYTDYERLASSELVYTGIIRTPVMAVTDSVMLDGRRHPLVAENFATMSDVYRLLGQLDEDDDMLSTADGAGKNIMDSSRRLARMTGQDIGDTGNIVLDSWQSVASYIADRQMDRICLAVEKVLIETKSSDNYTIVGAGAGRFLSKTIAARFDLPYIDFADLMELPETIRANVARSAPAVAVALLARQAA